MGLPFCVVFIVAVSIAMFAVLVRVIENRQMCGGLLGSYILGVEKSGIFR